MASCGGVASHNTWYLRTDLWYTVRGIGTDTGCAGCRRVERTVKCEEHARTYAVVRVWSNLFYPVTFLLFFECVNECLCLTRDACEENELSERRKKSHTMYQYSLSMEPYFVGGLSGPSSHSIYRVIISSDIQTISLAVRGRRQLPWLMGC